jgi:hypothetical protein
MRQWGFRRPCLGVCADAALPAPFPGKPLSIPLADGRPLRRRRQRPGQRQPTAWRPTVATEHQQQVLTHNEGPFRDRHPQILVRILAEDAYKFKREQRVRGQHTVGARSFAFHPARRAATAPSRIVAPTFCRGPNGSAARSQELMMVTPPPPTMMMMIKIVSTTNKNIQAPDPSRA